MVHIGYFYAYSCGAKMINMNVIIEVIFTQECDWVCQELIIKFCYVENIFHDMKTFFMASHNEHMSYNKQEQGS